MEIFLVNGDPAIKKMAMSDKSFFKNASYAEH